MADFNEIAKRVADVAQRVADVSDAARGKGARIGAGNSFARWLILPAEPPSRFVPHAKERAPEIELTGFAEEDEQENDGQTYGQLSLGAGELDAHLRERAERRERRRASSPKQSN
jgi:hypothetical protein